MRTNTKRLVGVISDTHDLLRPQAVEALRGAELIIHAGDACTPPILEELRRVAPVVAVRGNNDRGVWAKDLSEIEIVPIGSISICVIHDLKALAIDPVAAGCAIVVSGHSHKPFIEKRQGIIHLNPGSAGRRRFSLPVSLAHLEIDGEKAAAKIIELCPHVSVSP